MYTSLSVSVSGSVGGDVHLKIDIDVRLGLAGIPLFASFFRVSRPCSLEIIEEREVGPFNSLGGPVEIAVLEGGVSSAYMRPKASL